MYHEAVLLFFCVKKNKNVCKTLCEENFVVLIMYNLIMRDLGHRRPTLSEYKKVK